MPNEFRAQKQVPETRLGHCDWKSGHLVQTLEQSSVFGMKASCKLAPFYAFSGLERRLEQD